MLHIGLQTGQDSDTIQTIELRIELRSKKACDFVIYLLVLCISF